MSHTCQSSFQLAGKTILVTGAAGDIGIAVTRRLLKEGCIVFAADLTTEKLKALPSTYHGSLFPVMLDITDSSAIDKLIHQVVSRYGHLDALVNSAGTLCRKSFFDTGKADFQKTMELNVTAAFDLAQKAAAVMESGGSIVNIGSQNGFTAVENRIAYAASKAALTMMTKSMALELAALGIRVNQVAPGIVDSAMARVRLDTDEKVRHYESYIPLGRLTPPEAVAGSVLFFLSPLASSITGVTLLVDDGLLLRQNLPR